MRCDAMLFVVFYACKAGHGSLVVKANFKWSAAHPIAFANQSGFEAHHEFLMFIRSLVWKRIVRTTQRKNLVLVNSGSWVCMTHQWRSIFKHFNGNHKGRLVYLLTHLLILIVEKQRNKEMPQHDHKGIHAIQGQGLVHGWAHNESAQNRVCISPAHNFLRFHN